MSRFLLSVVTLLGFVSFGFAQKSDSDQLQGTWQITAMMDDGTLVPDDQVGSRFAQDGRLTISGQTIKFMIPGTLLDRTLHFVIDEKASPKTLDLGGAKKTG
ncbi:MAG: hypothetical protein K8T89_08605, partial [Planctomycetes bacterium]|nr:hypothetical protein [Planctomycetota bacterium]